MGRQRERREPMNTQHLITAASMVLLLMAAPAARGDVKNVWMGLQGAT
jgi:hypothetical protein